MKKARFLKSLVIICIILSFFSNIYAETTSQFAIGDKNIVSVDETDDGLTTKIVANAKNQNQDNGVITFTPKGTGVFTIDVEGLTRYEGQDICYTVKDSSGKVLRLAAVYNKSRNEYGIISSASDRDITQIDVLLEAGETYTISLSETKTRLGQSPSYGGGYTYYPTYVDNTYQDANYTVTLTVNTSANQGGQVYQSNTASTEVSDDVGTVEVELEDIISADYQIPADGNISFAGFNPIQYAASSASNTFNEYVVNPFEDTICDIMLFLGDQVINLMNYIVGEEVTVTALVYNQIDAFNPNFFDETIAATGITANIKPAISDWYNVFKMIAVAVYLVVLLSIGINILLASTGNGMQKGKELLVNWAKGLIYLVFIPYLIKYAFLLNESLVGMLAEASNTPNYKIGSTFGQTTEWSAEEIEFRSPEYVSRYTGNATYGSDAANKGYINRVSSYEQNLDLMRIMRAYAGVTKKFIYSVIWWILIGQLVAFIVQYYKRYFMIAFLIAVFPIICIFNAISIAQGKPGREIGSWMKEIFTNIFMQLVQAIIYTIITGICVSIVKENMQSSATLNWILIILAINFVSEGEKLLRKIIGAMGSSAGGTGKAGQGVKGAFRKAKSNAQRLITGTSDEDKMKK